jgi:hypothetical protein
MSARDDYGFLINPKNFTYKGYRITAMEFEDKTVWDVYLGHIYRETFNTAEAAKAYVNQSQF